MAKTKKQDNESLEQKLWKAADKLRKNIDAAEYKHITFHIGLDISQMHLRCL